MEPKKRKEWVNSMETVDNPTIVSEEVSVREAGRKGGIATRDRYGSQFYRRIGYKGGESTRKHYASLLKEFGQLGGRRKRPSISLGTLADRYNLILHG